MRGDEYRRLRREADRYRRAAEDALEQLDWVVGYFHGAHKASIAASVARNRTYIREQLLRRRAEPTPSESGAARRQQ